MLCTLEYFLLVHNVLNCTRKLLILIFTLFIYGLFNGAVSNSEYTIKRFLQMTLWMHLQSLYFSTHIFMRGYALGNVVWGDYVLQSPSHKLGKYKASVLSVTWNVA
jgi:hypothetical protein